MTGFAGLWVYESNLHPLKARHESLNIWCSQREDAQKCWETQIAGQFDNQKHSQFQNKWCDGKCCSIISKNKVCRAEISSGNPHCWWTWHRHRRRCEEILSNWNWRYCCHTNEWRCEHHGFSPWLFQGHFWRFWGLSMVFSFPEWYSLSMFQQRQHPQS